jgi:hypothetical protein
MPFNGDLVDDAGTSMLLPGPVTGNLVVRSRPDRPGCGKDRLTDAG